MTEGKGSQHNLKHSIVPTWFSLVLGSWVGLAWASLISLPVGVGVGIAAGSLAGGFWAVPLWGTVWGLIGLGRQREKALRDHGITLLKEDDPLAQRVYALSDRLGLRTRPWVGIMPYDNAYAIGKDADNALVVVGQPLLEALSDAEVDAVIGHELGHIVNNDMRRMGLARSFQNSLVWYLGFSDTVQRWGRWIITWLSELFVLRLSRSREYWADAVGAALTTKEDMIAALDKLHNGPALSEFEQTHARLMIRGFASSNLLATHPTLEERRAALEAGTYSRQVVIPSSTIVALAPSSPVLNVADIAYAREN